MYSKYSVSANIKGIDVQFQSGLGFSLFMLNILTVMDNHNTLPDNI
jgi:hypothetical protein